MEPKMRGIDILALFFATVGLIEAVVCLVLQPGYRQLFTEFATALPPLTVLMLQPATLVVWGLVPLLVVSEGVWRRRSERTLIALTVMAIVCAIALVVVFGVAMYLPLWSVADAVR
ncbi:MAG TPA: hypothetical protein VGD87_09705 [Archangium sp.]